MDRDPAVFGRNVRAFRRLRHWSIRELASRAEIDTKTVMSVERGQGCTVKVEDKLRLAFQTYAGRLWDASLITSDAVRLLRADECRWFFTDPMEAKQYHERMARSDEQPNEDRYRQDPNAIQNAEERHRLGVLGLARAFSQTRGGGFGDVFYRFNIAEIYHRGSTPAQAQGLHVLTLCDRGSALLEIGESKFELHEGDSFARHATEVFWSSPLQPVTNENRAPILRHVALGVLSIGNDTPGSFRPRFYDIARSEGAETSPKET